MEVKAWGEMTDAEKGKILVDVIDKGKQCQILSKYTGMWEDHAGRKYSPRRAYRIKPDPVREKVTFTYPLDTHRITFETIDGVPDCATIRMEVIK